jgi:drug/metabolite transporter (DMT)-like permease
VAADVVLRRTNSLTSGMWVSAGASVGLFLWSLAIGHWRAPSPAEWGPIVGMGFATAGAFVCLMEAIRRVGALRTAIISALEPLAASVLAWIILGERVSGGVAFGGALILSGAVTASLARRTPPAQEQQIP